VRAAALLAVATLALTALTALTGCGADEDEPETLTVFAAASLSQTFEELATTFEDQHPDVDVRLSFDGSSGLVEQIQGGAPADVFASADTDTMQTLVDDGLADDPRVFARNTLEIAVPPGNPAGVTGLADLAAPGLRLVTCAPEVPCGAATQQVAARAGVRLSPVSEEQSVTDVLGKVRSGEADAGLVYVTDVRAAGDDVEGVAVPEAAEVVNDYPIATISDSPHADLAAAYVDFVLSDEAQQVLTGAGFRAP